MTILPIKSEKNEGSFGGLASQFGVNLSQSSNNLSSVQLIPDLINSKSLLSRFVKSEIYNFQHKRKSITNGAFFWFK